MYICRVFPIKKNKVLFVSYFGKYYNDSPAAISKQLENSNDIDIVWAIENKSLCPKRARCVSPGSLRYIYELATSKVWVDNSRKRVWVKKRKGQYYIQTWHGNISLKKYEGSAENKLSYEYIKRAKQDSKYIDLITSGSDFFTEYCKKFFWYDGEILKCGTPRLDIMRGNLLAIKNEIRSKYNIDDDAIVVLYAPTFRDNGDLTVYDIDYNGIINQMEKNYNADCFILLRLHPNIMEKGDAFKHDEKVINASQHPDLYELIIASDYIISDYSSLVFDAGIIEKKVFLYMPDYEQYSEERGLYWKIEQLPFPCTHSNEELLNELQMLDEKRYFKRLRLFNDSLGIFEPGDAAKRIADIIIDVVNNGK